MKKIDWYQDEKSITITLYYNNIIKESIRPLLNGKNLRIQFVTPSDESSQNISLTLSSYLEVPDPFLNNFRITSTEKKTELNFKKVVPVFWHTLEERLEKDSECDKDMKVPSDKFDNKYFESELKDENDTDRDGKFLRLLQEIYSSGDDDTKRAMIKSFTTSSGKVLSTNWEDVKDD